MPIEPERLYDAETAERAVGKASLQVEFLLQAALEDNKLFADLYDEIEHLINHFGIDESKTIQETLGELLLKIGTRCESPAVKPD